MKSFVTQSNAIGASATNEQTLIRRYARGIRWAAWALLAGSALFAVMRWMMWAGGPEQLWLPEMMRLNAMGGPIHLAFQWRAVGLALECVPLVALWWTVNPLATLCLSFEQGGYFQREVVQGFKRLGQGLLGLVGAQLIYDVGVTALLTWLAHQERGLPGGVIAVGVSGFELALLLVAATMLLLARVMAQGERLQDDLNTIV